MSEKTPSAEKAPAEKEPGLYHNLISLIGGAIVTASIASIIFLILVESFGTRDNPYLGIYTYIMFPAFLVLGILVIFVGMHRERRRRRQHDYDGRAYPVIDLNDAGRRRSLKIFAGLTFVFLLASGFGSYRAYEYTESVQFCGQTCHVPMTPEFVTFSVAPHSRIHCVDCHVGSGADWYVRSKLAGARQLYAVVFNSYQRPIPTPVHNLRPARDTCEHCHWPEKNFGQQLKVFNRYGYDEKNTPNQTRMLINTGGGSPESGPVAGIHWHMNLSNEITYIAADEQRQVIPWVRMKDGDGKVTEYRLADVALTPEQIEKAEKRRIDCIDCHNRPTHIYIPPDTAVNDALAVGKLDIALPFLKRQTVEALVKPYASTDEALRTISSDLDAFYRSNYPDLYAAKRSSVQGAIAEAQRIYKTYLFPEMKVDWRTHPNNIGHYESQGCFRCHDGKHVSSSGKVIRNDCNLCHTVLDQANGGAPIAATNGAFRHPIDLGSQSSLNCNVCHKGGGAFQHPVNLGDISEFKCTECHKR